MEQKIHNWLTEISNEGNLPEDCQAIYIGLFENETGDYMLHFLGSTEFDPEDDDWACENENDFLPKIRYLESGVSNEIDWKSFQDEVVSIIKTLKSEKNLVLSQVKNIAVGFDSGDLEYI